MDLAQLNAALDAMEAAPAEAATAEATTEATTEAPATEATETEEGATGSEQADETQGATGATAAVPAKPTEAMLFSEEALSTKEGVEAARAYLTESQAAHKAELRKNAEWVRAFNKRQIKQRERGEALKADEAKLVQIGTEQREIAKALRSGSAKEIAAAFSRLTGQSIADFVRETSHLLATDGKSNGKGDPAVAALNEKLEAMQKAQAEREQRDQEAAQLRQIEAAKDSLLQVAKTETNYPLLAAYANANAAQATEVREYLADLIIEAHKAGNKVTPIQAAQYLENLLTTERDQNAKVATAASVSGAQAKPAPGKPPTKQQPLNSRDLSTAPTKRARTEPESVEELSKDKGFLAQLGFM